MDAQFDVEDEGGQLLEDVHDVDRSDFLHVVGSRQSGMYLTLSATHTGVGQHDQTNEVVEVEMDVVDNPEDELLVVDLVEDVFVMLSVAEGNVDAEDVPVDIPVQK